MPSWFELAHDTGLQQGDILKACPVPILPAQYPPDAENPSVESPLIIEGVLETRNVVVLSQSCDLINRKLASVIVAPLWPVELLPELMDNERLKTEVKNFRSMCDFIREGYSPRFHMLDACKIEGHEQEITVVDFWAVYTVPFGFLEKFTEYSGARLRLLSPYTEHLSQAFARFIMRVGLPSPIPEFKKS